MCHILQIIKTSDTTVRVIVEGECRARLHRLWQKKPFLQAQAELLPETESRHTARSEALIRRTYVLFGEYRELVGSISDDFSAAVLDCGDTGRLADLITQNINLRHQDRQRVLEELHPDEAAADRQRHPDPRGGRALTGIRDGTEGSVCAWRRCRRT